MDGLDDQYVAEERRLFEREFSGEERKALAEKGHAMPDGSFPIETVSDLENAIRLWGHSSNPKAAKRHIIKRARALGALERLPSSWHAKGRGMESESEDESEDEDGGVRSSEGVAGNATKSNGPSVSEPVDLSGASRLSETVVMEPRAVGTNGKHVLEVTLISEGRSKMGNHYPRETLRGGVPLFEGARAFVDHARDESLPERSVRDLVGFYRNVRHEESGTSSRVRGELHLVPGNEWLFNLLREAENNPGLCGLSIDAWCDQDPSSRQVRSFRKVESVDIVTRPSAGGQVNRILQSERRGDQRSPGSTGGGEAPLGKESAVGQDGQGEGQTDGRDQGQGWSGGGVGTAAATRESDTGGGSGGQDGARNGAQNADIAKLVEGLQADRARMARELEQLGAILSPSSSSKPDPQAELTKLAEELRRQQEGMKQERDLANVEVLLAAKLTEAALPEPVAAKLRKRFGGRVFEASSLEAAIAEEKETLAALTAAGQITGMGYEKSLTVGFSEFDQIQAAFDKLFDVQESEGAASVPPFAGIREAFYVATGMDIASTGGADRILTPAIREALRYKVQSGRLTEAEVLLKEADVTTASFSYLLGTSMNKRLLKDYQAWPSEWQKFSTIVAIKDFKQQSRVRLGAFGSLSTVAEDAAYTTLSVADTQATYTATKRGNLVQVTRETIINDDLYAIKQIPQKLAVAAAFTLAEFVYNLLAPGGGNIYDAHPLFDSINHGNTGVVAANLGTANSGAALASAALQTAVIKMRKQQNMAGKPIGLKPRFILVPPDLEFTAMTILKSAGLPGGNNNDINPTPKGVPARPLVSVFPG